MVIPNLPDTVCTIVNRSSDQETCLAWNDVRAWASKHNYTPPRNKPQQVNYVWIADHTKLDIFVKTTQNPDGTWNSKRVWLTGIIDAATNALVSRKHGHSYSRYAATVEMVALEFLLHCLN